MHKKNTAKDALTRARARRSFARLQVYRWLKQLGLDARAAFGGKTEAVGYKRLFADSPSRIMGKAAATRMEALRTLCKALLHPDTPAVLAAQHAVGVALIDALADREAEVQHAEDVVGERILDIAAARGEWFAEYKTLHGNLTAKFPLDKDIVDAYFDDPPRAASKEPAPEPPQG